MKTKEVEKKKDQMKHPEIVSEKGWEAAREKLLVKEKELTHARDALAAERRRMPWMAVEKEYKFEGPKGKISLLDLFEDLGGGFLVAVFVVPSPPLVRRRLRVALR